MAQREDQPAGLVSQLIRNRWFLVCASVLAVLTAGFELHFRDTVILKGALPLKRKLEFLNRDKLTYQDPASGKTFSYRLEGQPVQLQPEMVDALGTSEYIGWYLKPRDESTREPAGSGLELFVTYYTGKPDQVPHVPEQCMRGNGFQQMGDRLVQVNLAGLAEKDRQVPVKVLLFQRNSPHGQLSQIVMYTFRANDVWAADRDRVRWILGDYFAKYAYFSKIEVMIPLPRGLEPEDVDRAIEAGKRFLQTVLPVLVVEHYPDWPTSG